MGYGANRQMELKTRSVGVMSLAALGPRTYAARMKISIVLCSLVLTVGVGAQGTAGPCATKKAEAAKKADAAKVEAPPQIDGMVVPRGALGFMAVQIVGNTFKISFYDAKKKPTKADVTRAILRWDPKYKVGSERVVLNLSEDGKSLASPRNIRPPYLFKLFITLLKDAAEGEDAPGETHVIDFRD